MGATAPVASPAADATPPAGPQLAPPSLRRLGPYRVEVTDEVGRILRLTTRFVHVRAGHKLRIRVVPQHPAPGGCPAKVTLVPTDAFKAVVPPHEVTEGAVVAVTTYLQARQRGRVPLPRRAEVVVTLAEHGKEPYVLVVPFAVWPSRLFVLSIGFASVAFPLIFNRFIELSKTADPLTVLIRIATDFVFVTETGLFGVAASLGLQFLGWGAIWLGLVAGDAE